MPMISPHTTSTQNVPPRAPRAVAGATLFPLLPGMYPAYPGRLLWRFCKPLSKTGGMDITGVDSTFFSSQSAGGPWRPHLGLKWRVFVQGVRCAASRYSVGLANEEAFQDPSK